MENFPSNLELTAASALLLLSNNLSLPKTSSTTTATTSTSPLSKLEEEKVEAFKSELCKKSDEVEMSSFENSIVTTPCLSSLTNDDSADSHRYQLMASAVARYHDMALKVVRRARSKVIYRGSTDKKPAQRMWVNPPLKNPLSKASTSKSRAVTEGTTTTESSCLSSGGTSEISSARTEGKAVVVEQRRRRGTGSTYISRRAEAILRLLSYKGCASEVRIRQLLGDSPDTSKALRMLLKMDEVKRCGAGGRLDPYIYMIAADSGSVIT